MQYDMNKWECNVHIYRLSFNDKHSAITCKLHETDSSQCKIIIIPFADGRNICKVSLFKFLLTSKSYFSVV